MITLQNFLFNGAPACPDPALFYHLLNGKAESSRTQPASLRLAAGSALSCCSYFNAFSLDKWQRYCGVNDLRLEMRAQGTGEAWLCRFGPDGRQERLVGCEIDAEQATSYSLPFKGEQAGEPGSLLYLLLSGREQDLRVEHAAFACDLAFRRQVRLAIVITTFHREKFVQHIMEQLTRHLLDGPAGEMVQLYIIDNGNSLPPAAHPRVSIIPNRNLGGSGGFARGMLEVATSPDNHTHLLLCDDDVLLLPESITRLRSFLALAKNPALCVSGAMLRTDHPTVLHENGATLREGFHFIPNNYNLDLKSPENVRKSEEELKIDYGGWWFFAFPRSYIDRVGYPFPAFLRWDDAEYSLRLRRHDCFIVPVNGVAVWHEPFEYKFSPVMYYYEERNLWVGRSLYDNRFSWFSFLRRTLLKVMGHAVMYRYQCAAAALRGARDGLRGPEFFMETDPLALHREIIGMRDERPHNITDRGELSSAGPRSFLLRLLALLTLNGHLLPARLARLLSGSRVIVRRLSIFSTLWTDCFGAQRVTYVVPESNMGFTVERSVRRFLKVFFDFLRLCLGSGFSFHQVKRRYRKKFAGMTSEEFWRSVFRGEREMTEASQRSRKENGA